MYTTMATCVNVTKTKVGSTDILDYTRLMKSAPTLSAPFMYCTMNEYSCRNRLHLKTRLFKCFAVCRYCKGWWSVWRTNFLPHKNRWYFRTAQTSAKHSRSTVEYLLSRGESVLLAYETGCRVPSFSCSRTAPTLLSDASVLSMKSLRRSGACKMGAEESFCLKLVKARSCSSVHWIKFLAHLRVRSVNGFAVSA